MGIKTQTPTLNSFAPFKNKEYPLLYIFSSEAKMQATCAICQSLSVHESASVDLFYRACAAQLPLFAMYSRLVILCPEFFLFRWKAPGVRFKCTFKFNARNCFNRTDEALRFASSNLNLPHFNFRN